jgi:hypothetical protein
MLACLTAHRSELAAPGCKRQMLRLLGLVAEDPRMSYRFMQVRV